MLNYKIKFMKTRINFLDNLRTFLIFLVIVLHAGIVYEPILEEVWIVSDPVKQFIGTGAYVPRYLCNVYHVFYFWLLYL